MAIQYVLTETEMLALIDQLELTAMRLAAAFRAIKPTNPPSIEFLDAVATELERIPHMIEVGTEFAIRKNQLATALAVAEFDLRETLRAVLHFYGPEGANKITTHVMMARKSRDTNAEIDVLESTFERNQ